MGVPPPGCKSRNGSTRTGSDRPVRVVTRSSRSYPAIKMVVSDVRNALLSLFLGKMMFIFFKTADAFKKTLSSPSFL